MELIDGIPAAYLDGQKHGTGMLPLPNPQAIDDKLYTHAINQIALRASEVEAIWAAQRAYYAVVAAKLEASVPGISQMTELLEAADSETDRYNYEFEEMLDDEGNDGSRPPKPIDNSHRAKLDTMIADHPRAALYLKAKAQSESVHWSDNTGAGAAGKRAMDILADGGSVEDAEIALAARRECVD